MKAKYFIYFLLLIAVLVAAEWLFLSEYFHERRAWRMITTFITGLVSIYTITVVVKHSNKDMK